MSENQLPQSWREVNKEMAGAAISLVGWVQQLEPYEQTTAGPEGWSVKDHIAHLDAWLRGMVALLRHQNRVEAMGLDMESYLSGDFDRMNAVIYAQHRDESWETVWDSYMQTFNAFNETISELDDADLQKTYSDFQPDEPGEESSAPIVGKVAANSYEHIREHLPWMHQLVAALQTA